MVEEQEITELRNTPIESAQISAMVIGGVASSFLGRPRMTQDVDALAILPEGQWAAAAEATQNFGIIPRIDHAVDFARRSRVLLLKHAQSDIHKAVQPVADSARHGQPSSVQSVARFPCRAFSSMLIAREPTRFAYR